MVEGTSLQSRYRIDYRIAVGGMGGVYQAHDARLNRTVAVKLLRDELAHDPRFVERFRREARAVASFSHPNIANVYDYGEDGDAHFIVMEYAQGEDLARLLRATGPLSPDRAAHIAAQMCAALAHAHAAGIVHRDIKPANVIVGPGDHVKVTDFGIARAAGDSTLTATGSILGTAQYLSPEQAAGTEIGPPCDIYATGIVLYEMLTGTVPFTGDSAVAVAMRQISDPVPRPSRVNPDVPPELDAVVARATAKEPHDRFPDATAMADALREAGRPTAGVSSAAPETRREARPQTRRFERPAVALPGRNMGRALFILFGVLLLLAAGAIAWTVVRDDGEPARREGGRERQPPAGAGVPQSSAPEETPAGSFEITEVILGSNADATESVLREAGFSVEMIEIESEEAEGTVVDVDPGVGSTVVPGVDAITLYVSTGAPADDDEHGRSPSEPPGQVKKEEREDD